MRGAGGGGVGGGFFIFVVERKRWRFIYENIFEFIEGFIDRL